MTDLKPILGMAYREMVINHSAPVQAIAMFKAAAAADPEVVQEAQHRVARSRIIDKNKCFITTKEAEFFKLALEAPDPPKIPDTIADPTQDKEKMTAKLSALAGMVKTTVEQVENDAEAAVKKLQAAQVKASGGIAKINTVASGIEQSAGELEDFANQITNGGPPLEH